MKRALTFWFTGLSGSGKTTIAKEAQRLLEKANRKIKVYDGDAVRKQINKDLTFSPEDIRKNNRIIAELCLKDINSTKYDYIFVSVISPFQESRDQVKEIIGSSFHLIYCKSSLEEVTRRDPKGLYKKALAGEISNFIGIDARTPYQVPQDADLVLDTENENIKNCVGNLLKFIYCIGEFSGVNNRIKSIRQ